MFKPLIKSAAKTGLRYTWKNVIPAIEHYLDEDEEMDDGFVTMKRVWGKEIRPGMIDIKKIIEYSKEVREVSGP